MSDVVAGDRVRLRRAEPRDIDSIVRLATHDDVEPFMAAVSARAANDVRAEVERSRADPMSHGLFVIEAEDEGPVEVAGVIAFDVSNRRSRIADLHGLMLDPQFRGRGLATEATRLFTRYLVFDLGFHRVELECYGFNERAIRHFERAGFVREGIKRKAYWRRERWVDGVMFGLVREDLE